MSSLKEQLSEIESPQDVLEISFSENELLRNSVALAYIFGMLRETNIEIVEFASIPEDVLKEAFNLPFEEAIEFLESLYPDAGLDLTGLSSYLTEATDAMMLMTDITIQNKVLSSISTALTRGSSFDTWLESIGDITDGKESYFELVFRQNVFTAYSKGTFDQQTTNAEFRPYGLYDALEDSRISDLCESLNESVYPLDHPFWDTYLPPNHFNCRSTRIALTSEEVQDMGLSIATEVPDVEITEGFEGMPWDNLEEVNEERLAEQKELLKNL